MGGGSSTHSGFPDNLVVRVTGYESFSGRRLDAFRVSERQSRPKTRFESTRGTAGESRCRGPCSTGLYF